MKEMKVFVAKFWRSNPQLGGYYTTREIKASTKREAMKIVKKHENCVYGSMHFEGWVEEGN